MANDIRLGVTIRATGADQVNGELNHLRDGLNNAGTAAQGANRQFALAGAALQAFGGILAGISLVAFSRNLVETIERIQNVNIRLQGLTKTSKDYAQVQQFLLDLSIKHHKNNLELADSYTGLLTIENAGLITRKQSMAILEGLSNVQSKTGASAEQLKQSMYGLNQILGSGIVNMEDFRQLIEPLPGLLNEIAKTTGYTVGEFRKLVASGTLTSEMFGRILTDSLKSYQGAAEKAGDTLTAKYSDISNAWVNLARVLETPVSEVLTPILRFISRQIEVTTKDLREFAQFYQNIKAAIGLNSGGAGDNGMDISLAGRAQPPASIAKIGSIKDEIEANKKLIETQKQATETAKFYKEETEKLTIAKIKSTQGDVAAYAESLKSKNLTKEQINDLVAIKQATENADASRVSSSKDRSSVESEAARAAKQAADEQKRNYESAIKSSQDYIKQIQDEQAQVGMNAAQRATYAAEQIAAIMNEAGVNETTTIEFLNQTQQRIEALEKAKSVQLADDAFKSQMEQLIDQYKQLTLSAKEYAIEKAKAAGIKDVGQLNQIGNQLSKNADAQKFADLKTKVAAYGQEINNTSQSMQGLTDVTSALFDSTTEGFSRLMGVFTNLVKVTENYTKLIDTKQSEIDDARKVGNIEKQIQLQDQLGALQNAQLADSLGGFRQMAGAASMMFSEQSAGRKALHNMELVFGAVELAVRLKNLLALGGEAILNQGKGDPYSAFARIAAMIAIVGGVIAAAGGAFSAGGGSASAPKGSADTGTVLGDSTATSDSANKVYELLKSIHADEYVELRGINKGVTALHDAITGTVNSIFRADSLGTGIYDNPDIRGLGTTIAGSTKLLTNVFLGIDTFAGKLGTMLFGGKITKEIVGGGIATAPISMADTMAGDLIGAAQYNIIKTSKTGGLFGKKKTSFDTVLSMINEDVQVSLSKLFKGVGDTMVSLAEVLGDGLAQKVKDYIIPIIMVELRGLSAEDASKKLNGVISTVLDQMATDVFGNIIGQYQKVGEGMLETAIRIVSELAVVRDALKQSGTAFSGDLIMIADSLVQAAGGLEEFQKQFSEFYDKFFSAEEKQQRLTEQLQGMLEGTFSQETINLLATSRDQYRKVMEALDLTNAADRERYSLLLKLSTAADQYYQSIEATAKAMAENAKALKQIMDGLYSGEQIDIADQLIAKYSEILQKAQAVGATGFDMISIYEAGLHEATDTINQSLSDLLSKFVAFSKSLQQVRTSIAGNIATLGGTGASSDPAYQQTIIDNLYKQLANTTDNAEKVNIISEINQAVMDRYQAELDMLGKVSDSVKQIKSYLDGLLIGDKSPLTNAEKLATAQAQWNTQLALAKAGDIDAMAGITQAADNYLTLARAYYASGADYTAIFQQVYDALATLANPAGISESEYKAKMLEYQTSAITELQQLDQTLLTIYANEKINFDNQSAKLIDTLESLKELVYMGINNIISNYVSGTLGRPTQPNESAYITQQLSSGVSPQDVYSDVIQRVDMQAQIDQAARDAMSALGRGLTATELQWIYDQFRSGVPKEQIYAVAGQYIQQQLAGSHRDGLDYVPYDGYIAQLHKGERVLTAGQSQGMSQELVLELRQLREEVRQLREENRKHTGDIIRTNYEANDNAAQQIVEVTREVPASQNWFARSKAEIK
jgi:tape measure domain-containing protein